MASTGIVRAAIYCRVSTATQEDEGTSLESQQARCRAFVGEQGWSVAEGHVYVDTHSGVELWERPQLTRLRDTIRRRQVDAVVCFAIDRLARDPVHLGVVLSEAEHAGVPVHFVSEPLDDTPEGSLIRFVRGYAAKVEHEKIKERSLRGKRTRAESGRPLRGGTAPFGYRWADEAHERYAFDPETEPWARKVFAWALDGWPLRKIVHELDINAVPNARKKPGTPWCHATVRAILTNPTYAGRRVAFRYRRTRTAGGKFRMVERPASEQVALPFDVAPALVTWAEFEAVRARLTHNQQVATRNNRHPEVALLRAGLAACGHCGGTMQVNRVGKAFQYRCKRWTNSRLACDGSSIPTHVVDAAAWERVEGLVQDPQRLVEELHRMRLDDPTENDLAAIDRRIAEVERQVQNLVDQLANLRGFAATAVIEKLSSLEEQRERLAAERETIANRRATWEMYERTWAEHEQFMREVFKQVRKDQYRMKRLTLERLGVKVRIWRAGHEPRYEITANIPLEPEVVDGSSWRSIHNTTHPPLVLRWTDADCRLQDVENTASASATGPNTPPR